MHEFHVLVDTVCGKKKNSLQSGADVTFRSDAVKGKTTLSGARYGLSKRWSLLSCIYNCYTIMFVFWGYYLYQWGVVIKLRAPHSLQYCT